MKASLGLEDPERAKTPTPPTTPTSSEADSAHVCPHPMATVRASADAHHNRMVIYSPTTARRIPVRTSPTGTVLQITASKKPYKRGTTVACAFCRRRKIACERPKEGDEAGTTMWVSLEVRVRVFARSCYLRASLGPP